MKFKKIYSIITCIQASLFQAFALYVLTPKFALLIKAISHRYTNPFYYIKESDDGMFIFIFWVLMLIFALTLEIIGLSTLKKSYEGEISNGNGDSTFQNSSQNDFTDNYWDCPNCGEIMSQKDIHCRKCGTSKF